MPVVFIENYFKIYSAPCFSISTLVCILLAIFMIILPFFIADVTNGKKTI
jgi:hypothetical protein